MFLNSVTKVSLKTREGNGCGGTSLKLSLSNDDQDPCLTETKEEFNAGDLLEWSAEDLGTCSSATMILKSPKVEIITLDNATNICPERLTVRIDNNLFAASYEGIFQTFQVVQQQISLTGLIFSNSIKVKKYPMNQNELNKAIKPVEIQVRASKIS